MSDNNRIGCNKYNKAQGYNKFKGYYTNVAASAVSKEKKISSDTLIRQDVHLSIIKMLNEGKSKVEILTYLMNKYPNFSGNIHFSQQIEDQIKKREKTRIKTEKGVQLDGKERD